MDRTLVAAAAFVAASALTLPAVYVIIAADADGALMIPAMATSALAAGAAFGAGLALERRRLTMARFVGVALVVQAPVAFALTRAPGLTATWTAFPASVLPWLALAGVAGAVGLFSLIGVTGAPMPRDPRLPADTPRP